MKQTRKKFSNKSYPLKIIGKYAYNQSTNLIASTSKTKIYQAFNIFTQLSAAVKIISKNNHIKINQVNRVLFQNQIKCMHVLKQHLSSQSFSSTIVQIYDAYQTQNDLAIVMEYCSKGDLQKIIHNQILSQNQAIQYTKEIILAYQNLHQNNILHRDLKPANIFISQSGTLKIADFGYSCEGNPKARDSMIKSKMNVGSPVYMPIQSLEKSIYSFKSDIWSIGVIFFQMLTGKLPWTASSQTQLIEKIKRINIEEILPKNLSKFSKQFLIKSLKVNSRDRASVEEILLLIKQYESQSQIEETEQETVKLSQSNIKIDLQFQKKETQKEQYQKNINPPQSLFNDVIKQNQKHFDTQVSDNQQENLQKTQKILPQKNRDKNKELLWNSLSFMKKDQFNTDKNKNSHKNYKKKSFNKTQGILNLNSKNIISSWFLKKGKPTINTILQSAQAQVNKKDFFDVSLRN